MHTIIGHMNINRHLEYKLDFLDKFHMIVFYFLIMLPWNKTSLKAKLTNKYWREYKNEWHFLIWERKTNGA